MTVVETYSDIHEISLNFRVVLYSDLYRVKAVLQLPTLYGS